MTADFRSTFTSWLASLQHILHILYITAITFRRDAVLVYRAAKFSLVMRIMQWKDVSVGELMEESTAKSPNKICFHFEDTQMTFKEVNDMSNRIGNYFASKGFKKGDTVALVMSNRPEYPAVWLGLSKIGVTTALVNFNLRLHSLAHCVKASNAKAVIYETSLGEAMKDAVDLGELDGVLMYSYDGPCGNIPGSVNLCKETDECSKSPPQDYKTISFHDNLCFVYTSGTTGLPKAAVIKHHRFMMAVLGAHYVYGCRNEDVYYTPLPLYHMAGGMLAVGQAIAFTTTVVITRKFSASRFWSDCIRYDVTVSQYLGELARFLMSQPVKPEDSSHKVRLLMGTGLRVEMWDEFVNRFRVPHIIEFYGATEGNCSMANLWNHPGAIGYLPRILMPLYPMALIKIDMVTGEPVRDPKTGLGIRCNPGELGECMAAIKRHPLRDFPGYSDKKATESKIVHDIFRKGDRCFRAGDVMVMDELGYFYFMDRIGDTFRWKGENVSTMELETTISRFCELNDVAVYGVKVANMEGRAGMAAVSDPNKLLNIEKLCQDLKKSLPAYAVPLFVRVMNKEAELTGTYKIRKVELQQEGYEVSKIQDPIYFLSAGKYVPLTQEIINQINSGSIRL